MREKKMKLVKGEKLPKEYSLDEIRETAAGTPDWTYIENYIKSLPYSERI